MKKIFLALFISTSFLTLSVLAQIMSNPGQWYINNQLYSIRVFNGAVANSLLRKGKGKTVAKTSPKSKVTVNYTAFTEKPTNSISEPLAEKTGNDFQSRLEAKQLFDSFIALYKQTAQKDGFPSSDVAYAFEYFVINNYHIYHDLVDVPIEKDPRAKRAKDGFERITILNQKKLEQVSLTKERAVYNQFKILLSDNLEIQKMTDAQKQEVTETLAILFGINFATYMKGINENNDKLTAQARKMSKDVLENLLGISIVEIKITNNGLEL